MKKLIQATSIAAQDSESEKAIRTAKTSRLLAKKASNYIFYGAENAPLEKDTIDSMLDEFIRISSESKIIDAFMFWKNMNRFFSNWLNLPRNT